MSTVTAELALQGQNADRDRDILAMLRIRSAGKLRSWIRWLPNWAA
jgi:hypothetical protein